MGGVYHAAFPFMHISENSEISRADNSSFLFLEKTLLRKISHKERRGSSFFSCRCWRAEIKRLQVASFRNLKQNADEKSLRLIGEQIADLASRITNGEPYRYVVPVPGGSSRKKKNFASILAPFVARRIGTVSHELLEGRIEGKHSTSSHPMQSLRFQVSCRDEEPGRGLVLLVDDVATTGVHFSRCVEQLRERGYSAVCISWVS